jgi:hypothetical protein
MSIIYLNLLWRFTGEKHRLSKIKQRFMDISYRKILVCSIKTIIKIRLNRVVLQFDLRNYPKYQIIQKYLTNHTQEPACGEPKVRGEVSTKLDPQNFLTPMSNRTFGSTSPIQAGGGKKP